MNKDIVTVLCTPVASSNGGGQAPREEEAACLQWGENGAGSSSPNSRQIEITARPSAAHHVLQLGNLLWTFNPAAHFFSRFYFVISLSFCPERIYGLGEHRTGTYLYRALCGALQPLHFAYILLLSPFFRGCQPDALHKGVCRVTNILVLQWCRRLVSHIAPLIALKNALDIIPHSLSLGFFKYSMVCLQPGLWICMELASLRQCQHYT